MKFLNLIDGASKLIQDTSHRLVSDPEKELWDGKANANLNVRKQLESYSLALTDNIILADSTSSNITLTLPAASLSNGKVYKVKKINDLNSIIINANLTETIDGEHTYVIDYKYQSIELVCDGIEWYVM